MEKDEIQFKKTYSDLKIPQTCPGINWRHGSSDGDFDKEILPLLKKLNSLGFCHTTGSCAGHSLSEIRKYDKGLGVEIPYKMKITVHVRIDSIDKFMEMVSFFYDVSHDSFWCELGYKYDLNNKTEENYIPFDITVFCHTKKRRDNLIKKYLEILSKDVR